MTKPRQRVRSPYQELIMQSQQLRRAVSDANFRLKDFTMTLREMLAEEDLSHARPE